MTKPNDFILKNTEITPLDRNKNGSYDILISSSSVDGDNDTIAQDGWKLERYLSNPVVMYGHDYTGQTPAGGIPVGLSNALTLDALGLIANFNFREPANEQDFVTVVRSAWEQEFLRAGSVGFKPVKYIWNEERGGYDFSEQELIEWSIVSIPANADALRRSAVEVMFKSAGFSSLLVDPREIERKRSFQIPFTDNTKTVDADQMLAWVKQLDVDGYQGEQSVLATFWKDIVEYPEDAEKMTINAEGEVEMVPHPEAGKTVTWLEVNYSPPIKILDDGWEDAIYSSASKSKLDDELVQPWDDEDYEVKSLSPVLAHIPLNEEIKASGISRDICKLTAQGVTQVKSQIKAGIVAKQQLEALQKGQPSQISDYLAVVKAVESFEITANAASVALHQLGLSDNDIKTALTADLVLDKAGRVLSQKNESRINQAKELLEDVLSELETAEEVDDNKNTDEETIVLSVETLNGIDEFLGVDNE